MEDLTDFFEAIDALKHAERKGWKDRNIDRPLDTIASHSFGAALIGWLLSEEEEADTEKVLKMLLMHDLIMAHVEDVTPDDEGFDSKKDREKARFDRLKEEIPEKIEGEVESLFHELREGETRESQVARESDKIDTLLQARSYSAKTGEDYLSEFLDFYSEVFETDCGEKIFRSLKDEKNI